MEDTRAGGLVNLGDLEGARGTEVVRGGVVEVGGTVYLLVGSKAGFSIF